MDSAISRQIEKFKMGDFSGYQEFYDETVRTAYTMLRTIIPDEQMALAQIPAVYDSMYKNVNELERTELFYEWMGKQVNDVSLQCVDTGISGDCNVDDGSTNVHVMKVHVMKVRERKLSSIMRQRMRLLP